MRLASTICMGTCGNGVRTGMEIIRVEQQRIRVELIRGRDVLFVGAVGSASLLTVGRRFATTTRPASATSSWVSAS